MDVKDDQVFRFFIKGGLGAEFGDFKAAFGVVFGFDCSHMLDTLSGCFVVVSP